MPLKETPIGKECPLGKFSVSPSSPGSYDRDPVKACFDCNFSDNSVKEFSLEKICQCPPDITVEKYNELRGLYIKSTVQPNKRGLWDFVRANYKK